MKSSSTALCWEFWCRDRLMFPLAVAVTCGIVSAVYAGLDQVGATLEQPSSVLHSSLFICVVMIAVTYISVMAGEVSHRYTLPATDWSLAGWAWFNGVSATAAAYLVVALFSNALFDARWPLMKPTLAAACIFAVSQGIACLAAGGAKWRKLIVVAVSACCCGLVIWLSLRRVATNQTPYWSELLARDVAFAIGLISASYFAAVVGIRLDRSGRSPWQVPAKLGSLMIARLDRREPKRFTSPGSAQRWHEWISKGRALPITAGVIVLAMWVLMLSGDLTRPTHVTDAVFFFAMVLLYAGSLFGLILGHQGERFEINEFTAVRPLTDGQLADAVLLNVAKSVGLGWLVWAAGMAIALLCAALVGLAPTTPHQLVPMHAPPTDWPQALQYLSVLFVGLLLTSWTLASIIASAVLLRPWLLNIIVLLVCTTPIAIALFVERPGSPLVSNLVWGLLLGIVLLTIAVSGTALFLRLVRVRRVVVCGGLYALLCVVTVTCLPDAYGSLSIVIVLSLGTLPFLSLVAAPLALWWNRHR